jgi:hypothetical protein
MKMTARSATDPAGSTEVVPALVFEPPDQIEDGTGLYHTVLRCGVDLDRSDASRAGTRQVDSRSSLAPAPRGPAPRR